MTTTLLVGSNHEALLEWCQDHVDTGAVFTPESTRCVALLDDDFTPIVVVALDGWTSNHVEATIASDGTKRWANRRFISAVYRYVFDVCGKTRLNMITAVSNTDANTMHTALGHVQEGRARDWFGADNDAYLWGYTRTDWLNGKWHRMQQIVS
jgi:hypothetical protein